MENVYYESKHQNKHVSVCSQDIFEVHTTWSYILLYSRRLIDIWVFIFDGYVE